MRRKLRKIFDQLYSRFGAQQWWPGETPFEMAVGAILTQNTNWGNVEKAISNLKAAGKLNARALHRLPADELGLLIKPAGYFNIKAKRLKNFVGLLVREYRGSMKQMKSEPLAVIRGKLLTVNGIGPETADAILLYALGKQTFVIDAYTKRVLSRHNIIHHEAAYNTVQELFHEYFEEDVLLYNEYHALIVRLAKEHCKTRPLCTGCPLEGI